MGLLSPNFDPDRQQAAWARGPPELNFWWFWCSAQSCDIIYRSSLNMEPILPCSPSVHFHSSLLTSLTLSPTLSVLPFCSNLHMQFAPLLSSLPFLILSSLPCFLSSSFPFPPLFFLRSIFLFSLSLNYPFLPLPYIGYPALPSLVSFFSHIPFFHPSSLITSFHVSFFPFSSYPFYSPSLNCPTYMYFLHLLFTSLLFSCHLSSPHVSTKFSSQYTSLFLFHTFRFFFPISSSFSFL